MKLVQCAHVNMMTQELGFGFPFFKNTSCHLKFYSLLQREARSFFFNLIIYYRAKGLWMTFWCVPKWITFQIYSPLTCKQGKVHG